MSHGKRLSWDLRTEGKWKKCICTQLQLITGKILHLLRFSALEWVININKCISEYSHVMSKRAQLHFGETIKKLLKDPTFLLIRLVKDFTLRLMQIYDVKAQHKVSNAWSHVFFNAYFLILQIFFFSLKFHICTVCRQILVTIRSKSDNIVF